MKAPEYDVIIVGGGGSGLAAACAAAELGGRVLILEKQPNLGGTTGIAVGSFTAAGTSLQKQARIEDNVADHAEDAAKFAASDIEACNNHELRQFFLEEAGTTFEWLRGLGLTYYGPNPEPPNRVPRMHNVVPSAKAYIVVLQTEVLRRGGQILCDHQVTSLLRDGQRITGVKANHRGADAVFQARRGVVLAAGDYAGSAQLIAQYKGEKYREIEGINPHSHGDGHYLVTEAGGVLVNMDITYGPELRFVSPARKPFQQLLPAGRWAARIMGTLFGIMPAFIRNRFIKRLLVTWQHPENSLFDDGAVLLNRDGRRFVNERTWPEREIAVAEQPDKICYILLDGRLIERYSAWPHFISTAPDIAYAYAKDYLRLRPDVTITANDLDTVAERRGMETSLLREAVAQFNQYAGGEMSDPFGRQGDQHLLDRPWMLLGPAKAYFTTTEGGAKIDRRLRVIDDNGNVIPGLYAIGQNGLGGMVLFGHGLHIAWAMTSGRLAGSEIMQNPP